MSSKILVVDDEKEIADLVALYLENENFTVIKCYTAMDALRCIEEETLDMAILDVMLPDMDGLSILKKLRNIPDYQKIPVIFVSAKTSELDKVNGLDLGADDYLAKPFGVMELISRVKALLRRSRDMEQEKSLAIGNIYIDGEKHCVFVKNEPCELTYKEYKLLKLLIQNASIVLTRDRIMERIWGANYEGESRTLDMHIKTLRKKLGEEGRRIKTIRNVGYMLE